MTCPECRAENDEAAEVCFTCGKSLVAAPTAITRGTVIAERYEVLSPLGRGGMGMVYKAHDRVLDETVAVKTLRAEVAREAEGARRFRSEIKLARKIRHRNVCAIHEYGESGGLRYIAMELVDGVDLRRQIREQGALPEAEAYDVAIQAASGLQAIHNAGIIHRDLKTANIMRDATGRVRLMDFGIAKRFGAESTLGGRVVGTPEYMSPEQARGHKLGFTSDIYALGIVIYEVFVGRVPFQGETPIATILMHLNEPPPLEGPGAQRIPAPLVPVLRRALAKAPPARFATARELSEALESARAASGLAGGRGEAQEPGSLERPARRTPGHGAKARRAARRAAVAGEVPPGAPVAGPLASRSLRRHPWLLAAAGVALVALALAASRRGGAPPPIVVPIAVPGDSPSPPVASSSPPSGPQEAAGGLGPGPPSPTSIPSPKPPPPRIDPVRPTPSPTPGVARTSVPSATPGGASPPVAATPALTSSVAATPPAPLLPTPSATPVRHLPTAPPVRAGDLVEAGPGITPPQLVRVAQPQYPRLAAQRKMPARVLVRALVDENGKVVEARVAEGSPSKLGFDEAALDAAYKTLYKPALKDGVPVKMWIDLPVVFRP